MRFEAAGACRHRLIDGRCKPWAESALRPGWVAHRSQLPMSLSRYLFGDFQVVVHTSLPVSAAVGRLAAASDQSTFHAGGPPLRGYATVHEVALWQGSDFIINPFRPFFHGSFSQHQGTTTLSGTVSADWRVKLWCAITVVGLLLASIVGARDDLARSVGALGVAAIPLLMLHLSIRPTSRSTKSLMHRIETVLAGEGTDNSSRPTPLRDTP